MHQKQESPSERALRIHALAAPRYMLLLGAAAPAARVPAAITEAMPREATYQGSTAAGCIPAGCRRCGSWRRHYGASLQMWNNQGEESPAKAAVAPMGFVAVVEQSAVVTMQDDYLHQEWLPWSGHDTLHLAPKLQTSRHPHHFSRMRGRRLYMSQRGSSVVTEPSMILCRRDLPRSHPQTSHLALPCNLGGQWSTLQAPMQDVTVRQTNGKWEAWRARVQQSLAQRLDPVTDQRRVLEACPEPSNLQHPQPARYCWQ